MLFELVEKRIHLQPRKTIAVRVRQHGMATCAMKPADRLPEGDPPMGNITTLAGPQILLECGLDVGGVAPLYQEAREVSAAYDGGLPGKSGGTSQTFRDAGGVELMCDLCGTKSARHANGGQTVGERRIARVYAESYDMHGPAGPGNRDFDSRHEADAGLASRRFCLRQPADFVVVGKCEQGDAFLGRARDQRRGRQHSIGIRGVAV